MVTGTGTQKHDTNTGMQEEALYLVVQAGSQPGGPSNRATKILDRVNRQIRTSTRNSLESLALTHKTICQRTSGSEGAK